MEILKTSVKSEPTSILRNKPTNFLSLGVGVFFNKSIFTLSTDSGWLGDVCVGE